MSKINAIRLINLNYNNNAIRISDETFHMNGESTLLSLRNGGGKSVLVQMMMAPFVHKRYRDAKERPFESYFTTDKPTFILVEWVLDHGAGYVMAGMMVRRRQEITDANEDLEIIQFISEYRHACPHDIHHLPVIEKRRKEITMKSFLACRQLFDSYKKDSSVVFFSYDMNNSAQSRQYFNKLMEYRISYKEWETIMKKVNLKESGLSDLFVDCRDEKGLVEKWLLDAVSDKLNKEKDRMKEFQNILEKYVFQYKDNKAKIQRRDVIRLFKEEAKGIQEAAENYQAAGDELQAQQQRIGVFLWQLETAVSSAAQECQELDIGMNQLSDEIGHLKYEQISTAVYDAMQKEWYHRANREMVQCERDAKELEYEQAKRQLHLLDCARQQAELDEQTAECMRYVQQLEILGQKERDFDGERRSLAHALYRYYNAESTRNKEQEGEARDRLLKLDEQAADEKEKAVQHRAMVLEYSTLIGSMHAKIQEYDAKEESYNKKHAPGFMRNILGEYEPAQIELRQKEYEKELDGLKKTQAGMYKQEEEDGWKQKEKLRSLEDARQERVHREAELARAQEVCAEYADQLAKRRTLLRYFDIEEKDLYDMDKILSAAEHKIAEIELAKRRLEKEEDELEKEYQRLTQGRILELPQELEKLLEETGVSYVYGMEWLKKNQYSESENKELVSRHPFLPYALLLSARDMNKLKQLKEGDSKIQLPYTSFPVPMIVREQLERKKVAQVQPVLELSDVNFYMLFNSHLLNEDNLRQMAADLERQIAHKKHQIQIRREEQEAFFEKREQLRSQTVTKERQQQAGQKREQAASQVQAAADAVIKQKEEYEQLSMQLHKLSEQIQKNVRLISEKERRIEDVKELEQAYESYLEHKRHLDELQHKIAMAKEKERLALDMEEKLRERAKKQEIELDRLQKRSEELAEKVLHYMQYEKDTAGQQRDADIAGQQRDADAVGQQDAEIAGQKQGMDAGKDTVGQQDMDADVNAAGQQDVNAAGQRDVNAAGQDEQAAAPVQDEQAAAAAVPLPDAGNIEELENRYLAITSQLSLQQQEIERLLQAARDKEHRLMKELSRRQKKYHLEQGEWSQTVYDVKAEEYQEHLLAEKENQYEMKKAQWNEADKNAALASQHLEQQRRILFEKCNQKEPLPKEEIQPVDFDAEIEKKDYRLKELGQEKQLVEKRIGWYEENLTALAEYTGFMPKDVDELWSFMQHDIRKQPEPSPVESDRQQERETSAESSQQQEKEVSAESDHHQRKKEVSTERDHQQQEKEVSAERDQQQEKETSADSSRQQEKEVSAEHDRQQQGRETESGRAYGMGGGQKRDERQIGHAGQLQMSVPGSLAARLEHADAHKQALEAVAVQQSLMEKMSGDELRRKKGMLVRDYNHLLEARQQQKERLVGFLNQMVRRDVFAEDFYRKPIEAMLVLAEDSVQVIRQLGTTLQSYDSLMEKIQVDLSVIEDEKERIEELLGEYVREVHQNLGRIDHNSTIQIRGRAVKMLKITLPEWEENAQMYQMRIQDFMEETTRKGIELLERNENMQEYLGVRMTTKNLYDAVSGIENVQIRLYKIEEQREYPITWSQVARNSGGEGFLSAFIILSCLLYYMRHDDTDLFAERNEGKVLVMDNPFAQTNASHLLKPLMDMANKTNTQLICLSGLGGESIYNRFDNIYVLNLAASGLRNGMQYLRAEHMRGNETETMQVSQIEVFEQQELIF